MKVFIISQSYVRQADDRSSQPFSTTKRQRAISNTVVRGIQRLIPVDQRGVEACNVICSHHGAPIIIRLLNWRLTPVVGSAISSGHSGYSGFGPKKDFYI
jgi:hypothetical protein